MELRFLGRTHVGRNGLRRRRVCNRAGGIRRGGRGLSFCQHWQGCEVRDYKQQEHKSAHLHFEILLRPIRDPAYSSKGYFLTRQWASSDLLTGSSDSCSFWTSSFSARTL